MQENVSHSIAEKEYFSASLNAVVLGLTYRVEMLYVPKNMKLLAVPLFELYDNTNRYGPQLSVRTPCGPLHVQRMSTLTWDVLSRQFPIFFHAIISSSLTKTIISSVGPLQKISRHHIQFLRMQRLQTTPASRAHEDNSHIRGKRRD
jgi:hypothetical protein